MKYNKIRRIGFIICLVVLMLHLFGCASTGFLMAKPKVTMFGNAYPPKNNNATIDIYITAKPTQEYIEFARITIGDTNDKWCLEQITKKAREIGADAVIIIGKAGSHGVGIPIGYSAYVVSEEYGMTAIAIKYKQ
jgi:hypothetical protein